MTVTQIKVRVQPTEDPEKVEKAVRNLFGDISLEIDLNEMMIIATLDSLDSLATLRGRIARDKIRTTLRKVFTRWMNEDELSFGLNRQAAYAGHVSINLQNEDPMGPIQVTVKDEVKKFISFLCG
ncbi:MAG: hypothetical protein NWE89_16185 [Candidatus Bathyarchaeota archaeon]|nr:hypothetical protein [Candidatus Bathyarchaeota archaeon]